MTLARIDVDFVPQRRRMSLSGAVWMLFGLLAVVWTLADLRDTSVAAEIMAMKITRLESRDPRTKALPEAFDVSAIETATQRLMTPWSRLLEDLELAANDSDNDVALLEISPDMNKRSVRVSGEARTLPDVLEYVSRLQTAESLRYPLLENHEIQVSERERPVRFVVLADWRLPQ